MLRVAITLSILLSLLLAACGQRDAVPGSRAEPTETRVTAAVVTPSPTATVTIEPPAAASESTEPSTAVASPTELTPDPAIPTATPATTGTTTPTPLDGTRQVYLVPLGDFPVESAAGLADHYRATYGLTTPVLPSLVLPAEVWDASRDQLVAEDALDVMKTEYPDLASDPEAILIGLTTEDMFIHVKDWRFAFSLRQEERFAVISTARMHLWVPPTHPDLVQERLRKMVTKNIGVMYAGLPFSDDPRSALYNNVGGLQELDRMTEEFSPPPFPDDAAWITEDDLLEGLRVAMEPTDPLPLGWTSCLGNDAGFPFPYAVSSDTMTDMGVSPFSGDFAFLWAFPSEADAEHALGVMEIYAHCLPMVEDLMESPSTAFEMEVVDVPLPADRWSAMLTTATLASGEEIQVLSIQFRTGRLVASVVGFSTGAIDQEWAVSVASRLAEWAQFRRMPTDSGQL